MIVVNVEIKQMYIKVEIKIKPIKNNCWNCRKSIVFKLKLKYKKSILFQRKSWRKEVNILSSFDLIWRLIVLLLLSNSKDDENQNSQD